MVYKSVVSDLKVFVSVSFQLGNYSPFFRDLVSSTCRKITDFAFKHPLTHLYIWKENEVAEAQPPPVILYPHSQDQSHNNGAGHYSQGGPVIQPIEPPPQPPVSNNNNYPTQYEPRVPETRHTGHTDGQSGAQAENRHTVTPHRPPNPPVLPPLGNVETSASAVSVYYSDCRT